MREGIFTKSELFPNYVSRLNANGLFDIKGELIDGYIEAYVKASQSNMIEPLEHEAIKCLEMVELGRVRV